MIFNSWDFLIFLFFALSGYYTVPLRFRNVFVTFCGLYFYSFWSIKFTGILLFSSIVDYFLALRIDHSPDQRRRRFWLTLSVTMNLSILGFFKYFNFFIDNAWTFFHVLGWTMPHMALHVVLPVGVSFYTFQEMSYTIDVYRRKCRARTHYFDVAAFVMFFPQLLAGPIERASHLLGQLEQPRRPTTQDIGSGLQLVLWGLFQKVVIADNISYIANYVFDAPTSLHDTGLALVGIYAFALQIFCDFSGYTDIARGVAKWFGVDLMRNFNRPYVALSIRDFWARWHISLSTWLRDYLYISLGGNRCSPARVYFNLMITMLLGGLWHGATWLFVLWGLYHGLLLAGEHALKLDPAALRQRSRFEQLLRMIVTFHLVCFGWVLFRAQTVNGLRHWLSMLCSGSCATEYRPLWSILAWYATPLIAVWYFQTREPENDGVAVGYPSWLRVTVMALLFVGLVVLGADKGREFIYFQF